MPSTTRSTLRRLSPAALAGVAILGLAGCGVHLEAEPGVYDVRHEKLELANGALDFTYVTPAAPKPPAHLVIFASGDAGWMGASGLVFKHLARSGYYVAGYNSHEGVRQIKDAGKNLPITEAAIDIASIVSQAKEDLNLPDDTPTILTGFSRGASMVIMGAAVRKIQPLLEGAVAMSLTKEADYVRTPKGTTLPQGVKLDEEGRLLTYPLLERLGALPIAVIQADGDKYVPASEARTLIGPDTPSRRLYTVENTVHGFKGAHDALLHDLDDALAWVKAATPHP
jgi:predicted esterase